MAGTRTDRRTALGAVTMALLAIACGSGSGPAGASDPSGHTFVYLVDASLQTLGTYRLDETTGELRPQGTLPVPWPRALAADPAGRFVYVAGTSVDESTPGYVRTYRIRRDTGSLSQLSELSLQGYQGNGLGPCPSCPVAPMQLTATDRHVHVLLQSVQRLSTHDHEHDYWVPFSVDATSGALTPVREPLYLGQNDGLPLFAVDPQSGWMTWSNDEGFTFAAFAPAADGQLREVARSQPAGLALGSLYYARTLTLSSDALIVRYETRAGSELWSFALDKTSGRLTSPARGAKLETCAPNGVVAGPTGLVAVRCGAVGPLRLYVADATGRLELADQQETDASPLAFHPSGRMLLTVGSLGASESVGPYAIQAFGIGSDRRLTQLRTSTIAADVGSASAITYLRATRRGDPRLAVVTLP